MVGASWRLACTMLCEVGAKMGPRSTKIAQDGSKIEKNRFRQRSWSRLGAKLGPIFFFQPRPEAPGLERIREDGLGRRRRRGLGRVRVGKNPHPGWTLELDMVILHGAVALNVLRRIPESTPKDA